MSLRGGFNLFPGELTLSVNVIFTTRKIHVKWNGKRAVLIKNRVRKLGLVRVKNSAKFSTWRGPVYSQSCR